MSTQTIRVLLADDHPFMRVAYKSILERGDGFEVVAEASTGREAYFKTYQCKPDVVIMDVTLPDVSGIEIARKIVKRDPDARVLVSSMHKELVYAVRALKVGAGGYITKDCAPELLTEAVSEVAAGKTYLVPEIAQKLAMRQLGGDDDPFTQLSAREFEVLHLVLAGKTIGEIAKALDITSKTVSNINTALRSKLDVSSTIELFRMAMRYGLIDP